MPRSRQKKSSVENDGGGGDGSNHELKKKRQSGIRNAEKSHALTDQNISQVTRSKSKSNETTSDASPAKKLRRRLLEKKEVTATSHEGSEKRQKKTISSKYFVDEKKDLANLQSESQKTVAGRKRSRNSDQKKLSNAAESDSSQPQKKTRSRKEKNLNSDGLNKINKEEIKDKDDDKTDDKFLSEHEKRPRCTKKSSAKGTSAKKANKNGRSEKCLSKMKTGSSKRERAEKVKDEDEKQTVNENFPDESSSDSESEWEEVEELSEDSWRLQIPEKPVQITLKASDLMSKRKRGKVDIKDVFRRQLNRFRTESQENAHKVHLLCLLSHGQFTNFVCRSALLKSVALSLVPSPFCDRRSEDWTSITAMQFTQWFRKTVPIKASEDPEAEVSEQLIDKLLSRFSQQFAKTEREFILMFAIVCRSIGLLTRLIYALQPITFKPSDLKKTKNKSASTAVINEAKNDTKMNKRRKSKTETSLQSPECSSLACSSASSISPDDSGLVDKNLLEDRLKAEAVGKMKNQRLRRRGSKVNYDEEGNDSLEESKDEEWRRENDLESDNESESDNSESDSEIRRKSKKKKKNSSDEDFEESKVDFRRPNKRTSSHKRNTGSQPSKRKSICAQISDEDRFLVVSKSSGSDWWLELYLEEERKWICVNGPDLDLNCPSLPERRTTVPFSYILAFDNDGNVKDVTAKFTSNWLSIKNKTRVDEDWWRKVLQPFQNDLSERNTKEDEDVHEHLLKKPLPTSISDFKNHPLYALRRHLLKYEAIYPPDAPVLGHIRGEPVYPRESVHCLHAKEKWMLEGRLVRIGEEPYKIVKARPKWNKPKEFNDQLKLPLFGFWQTEQFIPLPAVDGKVPKNDYGNVEVFKPWMIPGGTVYLPETMSGLGRVAKKLDVDVAPAMVGWDFQCGFNVPILQGWIVCEEHKDVLVAAWEEDQAIQQQKEADKRQQRVLDNWKLLTRGLLIREKLKRRFQLQEPTTANEIEQNENQVDDNSDKKKVSLETNSSSWPENRKTTSDNKNVDSKNLFPFEKEHL